MYYLTACNFVVITKKIRYFNVSLNYSHYASFVFLLFISIGVGMK